MFQDTFSLLYKPGSERDKGTLPYLKCLLRQSEVSGKVMPKFDHCHDFLELVVTGYIIAFSLQHIGLNTLEENLHAGVASNDHYTMLCETAAAVVNFAFKTPDIAAIHNSKLSGDEGFQQCVCKEDIGGEMVKCSHSKCDRGEWFHFECKNLRAEDIPPDDEPWYRCDSCRERANNLRDVSADVDHKLEYSKAVIWEGLMALCRKDAVRENDGPRMIMHWKLDMMWNFAQSHPTYFIYAHRLLTDIGGGASTATAHQLMWNRTVNVHVGNGRNISADLHMEHLNNAYKESVKAAGGQLTDKTIERHSQMLGLQSELGELFNTNLAGTTNYSRPRGVICNDRDICIMVKVLQKEHLLKEITGRFHRNNGGFLFSQSPQNLKIVF